MGEKQPYKMTKTNVTLKVTRYSSYMVASHPLQFRLAPISLPINNIQNLCTFQNENGIGI